jgi:hypothetical protein
VAVIFPEPEIASMSSTQNSTPSTTLMFNIRENCIIFFVPYVYYEIRGIQSVNRFPTKG